MPERAEESSAAVVEADAVLLSSVDQAREALRGFTPDSTVGPLEGHDVIDANTLSLHFAALQAGYPGWRWTVTLSRLDGEASGTVVETELTPGDGALLAPEWVPWSERLADYKAAQAEAADDSDDDAADGDEDEDELPDGDEDDIDGIDVDALDDDEDEPSDEDESGDSDGDVDDASADRHGETEDADDDVAGEQSLQSETESKPKRRRFWQRRSRS